MKSFKFSMMMALITLMIGCGGENKKSTDNPPGDKTSPNKPVIEIANLPLEDALKTKYSKLQFNCSYETNVTRPTDGGDSATLESSKDFILWDILRDFSESKTIKLIHDFENIQTKYIWDFKVSLINTLNYRTFDEKGPLDYKLKNAVYLTGPRQNEVVELDESRPVITSKIGETSENRFYDRIPSLTEKISFGPSGDGTWRTEITINCVLEAEVNTGYEDDFAVSRP